MATFRLGTQESWPKSRDTVTPELSDVFSRLCIAADDLLLPEAIELLKDWLVPLADPLHFVHKLNNSGLCQRAPRAVLRLLNLVIGDEPGWTAVKLRECLNAIREAEPTIDASEYRRLDDLARRRGA